MATFSSRQVEWIERVRGPLYPSYLSVLDLGCEKSRLTTYSKYENAITQLSEKEGVVGGFLKTNGDRKLRENEDLIGL